MLRNISGATPVDGLLWLLAVIVGAMAFVFGNANVGFVVLISVAMLVEMLVCLWLSILYEDRSFGAKEIVRFWVEKAVLLMLPLVGSIVDWAWYVWEPPRVDLGHTLAYATTRVVLIGVLVYQLKKVVAGIGVLYRDVPVVKRMMHLLDKMEHGGEDPPYHRRAYDPPIEGDKERERLNNGRSG
jgi:hypothetical protein